MPNHVHLILAPATPEGLGRALGKGYSALRQRAQPLPRFFVAATAGRERSDDNCLQKIRKSAKLVP